MKIKTLIGVLLFAFFLINCDKNDDETEQVNLEVGIPDFQMIGEDGDSIYWYVYDADEESATAVNLSQEDQLDRLYISLRQTNEVLSFFSLIQGSFSLQQKNTQNGSTLSVENFISVTGERSIIWGTTSESQIMMAYYSPPNSGQLGLRTLDISSGNFTDIPLATNVFDTSEPLYFNKRLFISYLDNNNRYNMVVVNTDTLQVIRTFEFNDRFPSLLIDNEGNFVLILGKEGSFVREIYEPSSMTLLDSLSFDLEQFLDTGPLDAYLIDDSLFYLYNLIQPSELPRTPAMFNLQTGESLIVDILEIRETIRQRTGRDIVPTAFGFNVPDRTFLMGYAESTLEVSWDGGVMVIAENGELIDIIELPFVPTYFVKP